MHLVELLQHLAVVLDEGVRRAARALLVAADGAERRLAQLQRRVPGLSLHDLDAQVAQLEHVPHVACARDDPELGKVLARGLHQTRGGVRVVQGHDEKLRVRGPGGMQQVEPRGIAVKRAEAELAALLDMVGISVEHGGRVAARIEKARYHLAHAPQAGKDHLARLRLVCFPLGLGVPAALQEPVVDHEKQGRNEHGQRHRRE